MRRRGACPRPSRGEGADAAGARVAGEAAGDVQEPVAQPFRFAAGKLAAEQQPLCPGEQVLGAEREFEPGGVRLEAAEGQVAQAGVLAAADPVLDDGVLAVELLEPLDPAALLVGDEDLEAVAVVVGKGELRPRVRPLAAADRPLSLRVFLCIGVVRCCRGCGLRSGCVGLPSRLSSCNRSSMSFWRVGSRARSVVGRRRRWGSGLVF